MGVKGIDDQHKKLFDIINDLNWAKANNVGRSFISDILNRLVVYTIAHFSVEEELMMRYQYSNYKAHKTAHDRFKERVGDFIQITTMARLKSLQKSFSFSSNGFRSTQPERTE